MRVAVVTGASSGIGREFVRQLEYFYKDLDEIWVIARREERLEQLRKEVNVPLRIFAGDLQKKHVYRQFYTELCQWHPNIRKLNKSEFNTLLNSAGYSLSSSKFDLIISYCLDNNIYDLNVINDYLFAYCNAIL